MQITKISPQKRKGSFNIFIDGKYSFSLSEEDLVKDKLKVGLELSEDRLNLLKFKGKLAVYFNKLLNFLSFRPRSEKEVRDKLKEDLYKDKELSEEKKPEIADAVVAKLTKLNFVNDSDFGKWFIEQRQKARKPSGLNKIKSELYKKGLKKELIATLLASSKASELSEEELAFKAADKKIKIWRKLPYRDFKNKMTSYLMRHGFNYDVVFPVVDTLLKRQYNKSDLDNREDL